MEEMEEMELYSGSRVPKRYLSGVESWICDSGMDMFREGYHLMTKMFVEYVYYCKLYDIEPICTDRLFSKSLQKLGYPMKRSRYGTMHCLTEKKRIMTPLTAKVRYNLRTHYELDDTERGDNGFNSTGV